MDSHTLFPNLAQIHAFADRDRWRKVIAMPRARKDLVCVSETPYYHVTSRCVRRAFLCGVDQYSGRSYEHRRGWIEDRLRVLSSLFSVGLCAYAVMSNHYHVVVKLRPEESAGWTDDEVLARWTALFRGPVLVQRYRAGTPLSEPERDSVRAMAAVYRRRLGSLSWFMKCLNEPIARQANAEDRCTGHFWEARFHSQPLRSERALLAAMAYVDLNPVRAGMAHTPEQSEYTSFRARVTSDPLALSGTAASRLLECGELKSFEFPVRPLMSFADRVVPAENEHAIEDPLPLREAEYLQLVKSAGQLVEAGQRGALDLTFVKIIECLGLAVEQWAAAVIDFRHHYRNGDLRLNRSA